MKDYTVDDPKFSEKITITEITDTNHADNINKAPKQVFENTLFLKKSKVSADGGDVSDTVIQSAADVEDEYPIPAAGDTPKTLLGKTKKFFESIKNWMTGVCLLGHIVNNCVTDRSDLPLSAAQGKALMDAITVLNTNQENFIAKLGPYAFLESNNIDDYNEKALENIYRILYGIIDNQAYLSIDIAWVRIQFCTNIKTLKWRIVYGSSGTDGWHSFS